MQPKFRFLNSPKRQASEHKTYWSRYYAGYSETFAIEAVEALSGDVDSPVVLDPWNGVGTTTAVCARLGISSIGVDVNPVAVHAARGRIAPSQWARYRVSRPDLRTALETHEDDSLRSWFTRGTVASLRGCIEETRRHLAQFAVTPSELRRANSLALTISFESVRRLASHARSLNPAWIRCTDQARVEHSAVRDAFRDSYSEHLSQLAHSGYDLTMPEFRLGRIQDARIPDGKATTVITSPPYLTRLDYAVNTVLEQAVLAHDSAYTTRLRHKLTGTPLLHARHSMPKLEWGSIAATVLHSIAKHSSKASASYYAPFVAQYLEDMSTAIDKVHAATAERAAILLVIQDSWYKELRIPTTAMISEMLELRGWSKVSTRRFLARHHLARSNPRSTKYRSRTTAWEKVIVLRRTVA